MTIVRFDTTIRIGIRITSKQIFPQVKTLKFDLRRVQRLVDQNQGRHWVSPETKVFTFVNTSNVGFWGPLESLLSLLFSKFCQNL